MRRYKKKPEVDSEQVKAQLAFVRGTLHGTQKAKADLQLLQCLLFDNKADARSMDIGIDAWLKKNYDISLEEKVEILKEVAVEAEAIIGETIGN